MIFPSWLSNGCQTCFLKVSCGSLHRSENRTTYGLRGQDLNLRPSGYEPDELPDCIPFLPRIPRRCCERTELYRCLNLRASPLNINFFDPLVIRRLSNGCQIAFDNRTKTCGSQRMLPVPVERVVMAPAVAASDMRLSTPIHGTHLCRFAWPAFRVELLIVSAAIATRPMCILAASHQTTGLRFAPAIPRWIIPAGFFIPAHVVVATTQPFDNRLRETPLLAALLDTDRMIFDNRQRHLVAIP